MPSYALDFRAFEPLEEEPDHVQADSGTGLLNFGGGKKSRLGINSGFDKGGHEGIESTLTIGEFSISE